MTDPLSPYKRRSDRTSSLRWKVLGPIVLAIFLAGLLCGIVIGLGVAS